MRIMEATEQLRALLEMPDPTSVQSLIGSEMARHNRDEHRDARATLPSYLQDIETAIVAVQWSSSEVTLERALYLPGLVELAREQMEEKAILARISQALEINSRNLHQYTYIAPGLAVVKALQTFVEQNLN